MKVRHDQNFKQCKVTSKCEQPTVTIKKQNTNTTNKGLNYRLIINKQEDRVCEWEGCGPYPSRHFERGRGYKPVGAVEGVRRRR